LSEFLDIPDIFYRGLFVNTTLFEIFSNNIFSFDGLVNQIVIISNTETIPSSAKTVFESGHIAGSMTRHAEIVHVMDFLG